MKRILYPYLILAIVATLFVPEKATAQRANSLYFLERTPFHTLWNPAMAPKSSGLGIGLSNISLSVQSDLAFSDLFYPSKDGKQLNTFLHPDVDKKAFISGLGDISTLRFSSNMDILNLGIRILNNYFTFHSGVAFDAGVGVPKDLFKLFLWGTDKNSTTFDLTNLNLNAMAYAKYGLGYSMNLGKMFSVGINVNYLQGISDIRMGFDKLKLKEIEKDSETTWNINTEAYIQMAAPDFASFKYNEDGYFNGIDFNSDDMATGSLPKTGSGFSFDLGVTCKPMPFLTLSASLMDIGSIKWDADCIQRAKSNGTYDFEGVGLNDAGKEEISGKETIESIEDMIHFEKDRNFDTYSSKLTTKLNIGAEAGILNNKLSFGVLSQTGFATDGTYQDIMLSANAKPSSIIQGALTYSLLHGEMSSFGAAVNAKILFFSLYAAADYIPFKYTKQMIPVNNSFYNLQFGLNLMF